MSQNVMSYPAMADWIDNNRDPAGHYEWVDPNECACAQYGQSLGLLDKDWVNHGARDGFWTMANQIASEKPHTWGALSQRLRWAAGSLELSHA